MPFRHRYDLERHFIRHGEQFAAADAAEYERLAEQFLGGPIRVDTMECIRSNGDLVRYCERTGEFGVLSREGFVRTYLIFVATQHQTGLAYFRDNCGK